MDEILRTFKRHDFAARPDDFRKIDRRIAGTCADIEDAFTHGDPGPLPAIQNYRTPDTVLQSEPRQFLIMRTQNVIAFHAGKLSTRRGRRIDEFQARNPRPSDTNT